MNWFLNSHIENTRKMLNNELIFDPVYLEENDVMNPGAARWIRLTQAGSEALAAGRNINEFYSQLNVADITGSHLKLIEVLYDLGNRMSSASDQMQAAQSTGDTTLGEVEMLNAGSNLRLGVTARMLDSMAITPLAERAVANRQQFTSIDQFIRITGDLANEIPEGAQRILVKPTDIQGNFDYVPHSAATPSDPARMASVYQNILQTLGAFPLLTQPNPIDGKYIDTREVFNEMVRNMGVRNVEEFYQQGLNAQQQYQQQLMQQQQMAAAGQAVQVQSDEQVQQQVQAGNYVPVA